MAILGPNRTLSGYSIKFPDRLRRRDPLSGKAAISPDRLMFTNPLSGKQGIFPDENNCNETLS